jgi:hypothetical protein
MELPVYSKNGNIEPCPSKFHQYFSLQKLQNSILKPATIYKFLPDECDLRNNIFPNSTNEQYEKAKVKALEKLPEDQKDEYLRIEKEMSAIDKEDPFHLSWKYFDSDPYGDSVPDELLSDLKNCLFNIEETIEFRKTHNLEPIEFDLKVEKSIGHENVPKGIRHSQKVRKKCREIATKIWQTETITIADMCRRPEIKEVAKNKNGKPYVERTIRNWINDLSPNRSRGRRPKKTE